MNLVIEVFKENQNENRKAGIVSAFYSAYFQKFNPLSGSDLDKVLREIDEPSEMTDEEMFAVVKRMVGG